MLTEKKANRLKRINRALAEDCKYNSIQEAVFDARNNDRVVIMPGRYTEPESRQAPLNDPRCNPSLLQEDASGDLTPSYRYQATCPNDQNLVYVQGRAVVGEPQVPPLEDRHGIPAQELGKCVRCNLQIEGSGAQPTDVIIDGGRAYPSKDPEAKPGELVKDVIIRADRADGFVVRNLTTRGALRARDLRRGDRRLPDRAREDVLGGRLRQPHLHLRPRPVQELRLVRRRRRGAVSGLRARRPARRRPTSIPTRRGSTRWSRSATCAAARSATRARWATRCGSPTTTSTATRPGSPATRSRRAATPGSRPTARRSTTT